MAVISQPNLLPGEFASDGDKNTIPANNDGFSGLASIAKGFPPITQTPLDQGGLPPQRADFNGIFNLFSKFILYSQNGGVYKYSNSLDYTPPAIVSDDSGNFYQCIATNGENTSAGVQALTNTSYWQPLIYNVQETPEEDDSSERIPSTAWVQSFIKSFISSLSDNIEVEWKDTSFTVPALGITGLMDTNGYISLGDLFGGLIIQWGEGCASTIEKTYYVTGTATFPISFTNDVFKIVATHRGGYCTSTAVLSPTTENFVIMMGQTNIIPGNLPWKGYYIAVGY